MSASRPRAAAGGARHEVRLIGGRWKRSKLPVADRPGLRPTPDRVRETLFNWLGPDLSGWTCLDAFAGSGALGFEAASRGASPVWLLERDRTLVEGLRAARLRLGADAESLRVECVDALAWMRRQAAASFDLILLDPPYADDLADAALALAAPLLRPGGFAYVESGRPPADAGASALGLQPHRELRAGGVHARLLRRPGPPGDALPPPAPGLNCAAASTAADAARSPPDPTPEPRSSP